MEADRYDVLEKIGQGSFGIIRKVRRKSDGHILCRKEISYTRMTQKEREQLQAELQILKGLRHPNIVAYYEREHIKSSGDLHIYMEYCEQGDLGMRIKDLKKTGHMAPEDFVWSVFAQLVTALYRCHYGEDAPDVPGMVFGLASDARPTRIATAGRTNAMILHRDLKPENIFLGADASVKLGDFGLSKIMSSHHDFASTYVGTPFYMSPEICAAEQYSLHSDIWAFGCIMYELCSKAPPFNAKSHLELSQKIRAGKIDPLSNCYSQELKDAIYKCLRTNPTTRPDTVQLLNLPMVKLKRKEQEIILLGRALKVKEDKLLKLERDLDQRKQKMEQREQHVDAEREAMRNDIDNTLRREWEVKARLEIDRQIQLATQQLYHSFESEVQRKVNDEVRRHNLSDFLPPRSSTPPGDSLPLAGGPPLYLQSQSTAGDSDDFPSSTDISDLSLESPTLERSQNLAKRTSKTPFTRAHTMFEASPMDVQMADPSPAPIASLGLSPRQDATQKYRPSGLSRNLFASAEDTSKTTAESFGGEHQILDDDDADDDGDDDFHFLPSPTRGKGNSGDPFKTAGPRRPAIPRQKTAPPPKSATMQSSFISKKENLPPQSMFNRPSTAQTSSKSPGRRISKLPSTSNLLATESTSPVRKPAFGSTSPSKQPGGAVPRPVSRKREEGFGGNPLQGRTLVELAQARTAIVDFAGAESKTGGYMKSTAPVWDPEKDEMPSPFIVRGNKTNNVLAPALGGPGFRHLR